MFVKVSIAGIKALIAFLSNIEEKGFIKKFSDAGPILIQSLRTVIKEDEDSASTIIQSLTELIEAHPNFIKPVLDDLLSTLTEIMKAKQLTDGNF